MYSSFLSPLEYRLELDRVGGCRYFLVLFLSLLECEGENMGFNSAAGNIKYSFMLESVGKLSWTGETNGKVSQHTE